MNFKKDKKVGGIFLEEQMKSARFCFNKRTNSKILRVTNGI